MSRVQIRDSDAEDLVEIIGFLCDWFDTERKRIDHALFQYDPAGLGLGWLRDQLRRSADRLEAARTMAARQ